MVFAAMLPWQMFATAISAIANSLVANSNLVSKVWFPADYCSAATVGVAVVDFVISFVLLALMMVFYQYMPPIQVLAVLPLTCVAALLLWGLGLYFAHLM